MKLVQTKFSDQKNTEKEGITCHTKSHLLLFLLVEKAEAPAAADSLLFFNGCVMKGNDNHLFASSSAATLHLPNDPDLSSSQVQTNAVI